METAGDLKKGSVVTCEVIEVKEAGIDVKIVGSDLTTFIKRSELARDRGEQRPERFSVGQKVDARVIQFDRRTHKVQVSIKALEVAEEKEATANTAPPIRGRRSATSSAPRSSAQRKSRPRKKSRRRNRLKKRARTNRGEVSHVARCRYDRRSSPHAAQAHLLARQRDHRRHLRRGRGGRRLERARYRPVGRGDERSEGRGQRRRRHPHRYAAG